MDKEPINKIPETFYIAKEKQHRYQISVTDIETGEIIYLNQSWAGVMCSAEKVLGFGLEVETQQQTFAWGHIMLQMHLLNMLHDNMGEKIPQLIDELERLGYIKAEGIAELREKFRKDFNGHSNSKG